MTGLLIDGDGGHSSRSGAQVLFKEFGIFFCNNLLFGNFLLSGADNNLAERLVDIDIHDRIPELLHIYPIKVGLSKPKGIKIAYSFITSGLNRKGIE